MSKYYIQGGLDTMVARGALTVKEAKYILENIDYDKVGQMNKEAFLPQALAFGSRIFGRMAPTFTKTIPNLFSRAGSAVGRFGKNFQTMATGATRGAVGAANATRIPLAAAKSINPAGVTAANAVRVMPAAAGTGAAGTAAKMSPWGHLKAFGQAHPVASYIGSGLGTGALFGVGMRAFGPRDQQ